MSLRMHAFGLMLTGCLFTVSRSVSSGRSYAVFLVSLILVPSCGYSAAMTGVLSSSGGKISAVAGSFAGFS